MVGMAFSTGSPLRPELPNPYRFTFIGVAPVIVIEFTSDPIALAPATLVSPAAVDAVPPMVNVVALAKLNRPVGVGEDAAPRPVDARSVRPSHVSFSRWFCVP